VRLLALTIELRGFRPHILQSTHYYTNLYSSYPAPFYKAVGIGSLRNDTFSEVESNGFWGMKLLKTPQVLISNSNIAKKNAVSLGAREDRVFVLQNVIDLAVFDREKAASISVSQLFRKNAMQINAVMVCRLVPEKRSDRFLRALYKARASVPNLCGFIVGAGGEREHLEKVAADLGLFPDGVSFIGVNDNIPAILSQTDIFVLSSDTEGMPNVILEAMAASLPVITTPAGDANIAVENGVTGYVVPFNDIDTMATHMVNLSVFPELRKRMGEAGRKRVEQYYNYNFLGERLLSIYTEIGSRLRSSRLQKALLRY